MKLERLLAMTACLAFTGALAAGCGTKKDAPSVTGTGTSPPTGGEPSPNEPPAPPPTGTATLTWSANTEDDLAGYKVYVATASGTSGSPLSAGNTTTFQVTNLPIGQTYKFAVTAVDTSNNESNFSNEASKLIDSQAPGTPVRQTTTYYVDKAGSDSNSCLEATIVSTAKSTINAGISCLSAGDGLIVKAGTYNETFYNPFANTGNRWNNKITVKAESPRSVIVKPTSGEDAMFFDDSSQKYIEFDGIEVDAINTQNYGVGIRGTAHHIRFRNSAILNASNEGVFIYGDGGDLLAPSFNEFVNVEVAYTAMNVDGTTRPCNGGDSLADGLCHGFYLGTNNNLLDGVNLHHNNGYGVQFYPQGNRGNTIRNSMSHDNYSAGIGSLGDDNKIINNVVYNNGLGACPTLPCEHPGPDA